MQGPLDLNYLLRSYLADSLSDQEKLSLFTILDDKDRIREWNDLIENLYEETAADLPAYEAGNLEEMIQFILRHPTIDAASQNSSGNNLTVPPVRRLAGWNRWWAAAILLLLAGGISLLMEQSGRWEKAAAKPLASQQNNVLPGGNRAVLTLSNGQKITLDSIADGALAQQGNARILKLTNGQLTYDLINKNEKPGGRPAPDVYNILSTPRGGQYRLTLPDGTRVWLNAASSIRYPVAFTGADREVQITGEAYFEVQHLDHQPFKVQAGRQIIEDLGTHFNVNAYDDEPTLKASLLEGAVKVNGLPLHPGQQASIDKNGHVSLINDVDIEGVIAWKNEQFQFGQNADLAGIMRQLARWYDVDVVMETRENGQRFGGEIPRSTPLAQVLEILKVSGVKFTIEGKKVFVNP